MGKAILVTLIIAVSFSAGQVSKCFKCEGEDGDDCASGYGNNFWESVDCGYPDHDNTFCKVERNAGVWKRECCNGKTQCVDKHTEKPDGSTVDEIYCHSDNCNNGDPRINGGSTLKMAFLVKLFFVLYFFTYVD